MLLVGKPVEAVLYDEQEKEERLNKRKRKCLKREFITAEGEGYMSAEHRQIDSFLLACFNKALILSLHFPFVMRALAVSVHRREKKGGLSLVGAAAYPGRGAREHCPREAR